MCPCKAAKAKAQKRDDMMNDVKDVEKLWGDKPQKLIKSYSKVQKTAFPSQIKEELQYKSVLKTLSRGLNEDWRAE